MKRQCVWKSWLPKHTLFRRLSVAGGQWQWRTVALARWGEDLSYVFEETTPVKACRDLPYHINHNDKLSPNSCGYKESSSQVKRRRMLQFEPETVDTLPCNEEISSEFLKSNEGEDSLDEVLLPAQQFPEFPGISQEHRIFKLTFQNSALNSLSLKLMWFRNASFGLQMSLLKVVSLSLGHPPGYHHQLLIHSHSSNHVVSRETLPLRT
ncbi:hypothetical protein Tsubulata_011941 [Turnera subulata]|uniref:Uncharacterized protein n=1 Tax=Turnera subulata TaxID=218843 RepID=A0A9Q0GKL5_9ROSI|nr:hypothetical protein Tsubulata_011941 [Turnera subulata]